MRHILTHAEFIGLDNKHLKAAETLLAKESDRLKRWDKAMSKCYMDRVTNLLHKLKEHGMGYDEEDIRRVAKNLDERFPWPNLDTFT